jgi:hypothetical protein
MRKKTSSKEFLQQFEEIWKNGPPVKYSNPDTWSNQASGKNKGS